MSKRGRPTKFSKELADKICDKIATTPRGLDWILSQDEKFPGSATVRRWLIEHADFRASYVRAREAQADLLFDECLEIADDGTQDTITIETRSGGEIEVPDKEWILRSKLRVETRMRMAGKLAPKKYGEKIEHDLTPAAADVVGQMFSRIRGRGTRKGS